MNKREFLDELKSHLRVLETKEQQDILDEYAQHIDLKIKSGQSEEEAISDFGNIEELASDILEAYHVNPEFGTQGQEKKEKNLVGSAASLFGKAGNHVKMIGKSQREQWENLKERRRKAKEDADAQETKRRGFKMLRERFQIIHKKFSHAKNEHRMLSRIGEWMCNICILCWNSILFLSALMFGVSALFFLFAFGCLFVLVFGGYPVIGASLLSLGFFAAFASMAVLFGSCFRRFRKRRIQARSAADFPGEPEERMEE
ncbi:MULTISPECIES: DUF1700 domain-containing protein [Sellimonas]|uniref:DUF1700 domain-containing protein n=1 Tax=Sellimonas caecigallum TaxID=2592333 RepID=A0ABS7L5C1_9FIRM|nr:DUF1700 domain-containing protein [Sellimonas caecigallum]MBY0758230.1 DUF1700 domain-containing protein [Sellimonas caecigallum]OUP67075.1 hypothetical protein B5F13_01630 [Drancourtella sp. An177]